MGTRSQARWAVSPQKTIYSVKFRRLSRPTGLVIRELTVH
jgi:hypothetical protein